MTITFFAVYIFQHKNEFLVESDDRPDPDVIGQEIVDDLEAALEQFRERMTDMGEKEAL